MSIIFKKLKRLQKKGTESDSESNDFFRGSNVYTFKKLILSPKGILLIIAAIFGFACISFYSLTFLKSILDSGSQKAIIVQNQSTGGVPGGDLPGGPLPPPPPGQEMGMDGSTQTNGDQAEKPPHEKEVEEFKIPEYFVQKIKELDIIPQPQQPGVKEQTSIVWISPENKNQPDLPQSNSIYSNLPKNNLHTRQTVDQPDSPLSFKPRSSVKKTTVFKNHVKTKPGESKTNALKTAQIQSTSSQSSAQLIEQKKKEQKARQIEKYRRIKAEKTKKISEISTLASDLEVAIKTNNINEAEKIIKKLEEQTDKQSGYYIKLKAFKLIQDKNYDQAKIWLNRILEKDPSDLEAGLNMAIIDIRQASFEEARKRLLKLSEIYPSHPGIHQLLDQL